MPQVDQEATAVNPRRTIEKSPIVVTEETKANENDESIIHLPFKERQQKAPEDSFDDEPIVPNEEDPDDSKPIQNEYDIKDK